MSAEMIKLATGYIKAYPDSVGSEGLAEYFKLNKHRNITARERRTIMRLARKLKLEMPVDRFTNIITECFDYKNSEISALHKQIEELDSRVDFAESAAATWGNRIAENTENQQHLLATIDHLEDELDKKIRSSKDCVDIITVLVYLSIIVVAIYVGITNINDDLATYMILED